MSQLSIWTLAVLLFFLVLSWAPEARPVVPSPSLNDPAAKLIKERIRLEHPDGGGIQALAFSPDSSLLASANLRKLVLWDLALRKPRHVFGIDPTKLVTQLAFSTDGKTLITANIRPKVGKTNFAAVVTKWDVKTGVEKEVFFF